MKLRIAGNLNFNNRQKLAESGIVLWANPKPQFDKFDLIMQELEALQAAPAALPKASEAFDSNKVWFTRSEAANYLSVSAKTIDRCRIKQDLPYYQLEGRATIRFKRKDLDKLMR